MKIVPKLVENHPAKQGQLSLLTWQHVAEILPDYQNSNKYFLKMKVTRDFEHDFGLPPHSNGDSFCFESRRPRKATRRRRSRSTEVTDLDKKRNKKEAKEEKQNGIDRGEDRERGRRTAR